MKRFIICIMSLTIAFGPGLPLAAFAGSDDFLGDAAIYVGSLSDTNKPRTNVLFIVDNSKATMNPAAGEAYDPSKEYDDAGYGTWDIYLAGQQGDFTGNPIVENETEFLERLIDGSRNPAGCSDIIRDTLLESGTYTGSGSANAPNISNQRTCNITNNQRGAVYALGNYLNYVNSVPAGEETTTQREVIYNALKLVVGGARKVINFGALVYGSNQQGANVAHDMADLSLDGDFTAFLADIPGPGPDDGPRAQTSESVRPQSQALYDAGYYYGADYDSINNSMTRIPLSSVNPCGNNHIIFITNGLTNDTASSKLKDNIGDYDGDHYHNEGVDNLASYGSGSHYMDDVAAYLKDKKGITTHTVLAFQASDVLVQNTAYDGGGIYKNVFNAQQLSIALTKMLASILEEDTAFVAPVVPASATNRTISSDRVYLGLFKPQDGSDPWLGNVKKYRVGTGDQLIDRNGNAATQSNSDPNLDGKFVEASQSYWGTGQDAVGNDIFYCFDGNRPISAGDGGLAGCGGVGGALLGRTTARNIYTYVSDTKPQDLDPDDVLRVLTSSANAFSTGNNQLTEVLLNVTDDEEKNKLIKYMHGFNAYGADDTVKRNWILGDILHSRPLVFNYAGYTNSAENTCAEDVGPGEPYNSSVIFVGANDGMLHAFRDCDGSELWAFIPPKLLADIKEYPTGAHQYFVDSPPVAYVHDVNNNGNIETGDKIVLIFGLRRGGASNDINNDNPWGAYYALDVSTPTAPVLLWELDNTVPGLERMGQSWSQPRLSKVRDGSATKVVAFITGGYDKNEDLRYGQTQSFPDTTNDDVANGSAVVPVQLDDGGLSGGAGKTSPGSSVQYKMRGNAVYAIEVATLVPTAGVYSPDFSSSGAVTWAYDVDDNTDMTYAFPSDITLISGAGNFAEAFYVGDTGGRMWRFDVSGSNKNEWGGEIIFDSNRGTGSDVGRKIFYRPAAAIIGGKVHLWLGTGDRAHPLNHAVIDRMYHLVDMGQETASGIDEARLVDLTDDPLQTGSVDTVTLTLNKLTNNNTNGIFDNDDNFPYHGWFIKMNWDFENNVSATAIGEKVLAAPVMFNNAAYFTTYTPDVNPNADDPCAVGNLGTSRLYHLGALTAEAVFNYDTGNDNPGSMPENQRAINADGKVLVRSDRVRELGEGIPSGIVTLIDASGRVTMMISSSNRVGTYNAPDIRLIAPVYWMQW